MKEGTHKPRLDAHASQDKPRDCVAASLLCQSAGNPQSEAAISKQSLGSSNCIKAWFLGLAPLQWTRFSS